MRGFKESLSDNFALMKWRNTYLLETTNSSAKIKMYKINIIVFNEINRELYARLYFKGFEFSLDEFLSEVYDINTGATMLLSKEIAIDEYIQRLFVLIDDYIYKKTEEIDFEIIEKRIKIRRESEIHKYKISLIEREGIKAFEEKRYKDVIDIYREIETPNEIQRKRIDISKKRLGIEYARCQTLKHNSRHF